MLLDNPLASVWLTPCLNLMSRILNILCKHKAHRINLELYGDIVINHFRQLWSVIVVTGTKKICTVQNSSKRVEVLGILFQQLKNVSLVETISLKNMQLDALAPIDFVMSVQRHNRTENSQPSKWMEHSNLVAAKLVNLSMRFEGHRMQQAQYRSFEIYQCFF